ncbi:GNAT family N-acetyltransferase [Xylophilus sp. ASV27]|uniref:GNAT family N-acetyltransferase n=1 Tax=Xylophilus sp. ASV27 TaxID=2795129 RepID=UPI0018EB302C|nr:GNAT family N-acetyltransferase [Xylophilus sp. ASV27]
MHPSLSVSVRPAELRDAAAVAAVHHLHVGSTESVSPRQVAFWREAIEYGEPQVHVALEGERIVGFVGFDRSRDPKSKPTMGEVWALYVLPSHHGQGVGVALWDAAREGLEDEGCTHVTAWVTLRNERALRFFELAGFKREMTTLRTALVGAERVEEVRLKRAVV